MLSAVCHRQVRLFSVLGMKPTLEEREVRAAYHTLALQYHPDKAGAEDGLKRFKEIVGAKDSILSFLEKRSSLVH